jgi:phosphoglycolate phosphatase
LGIDRTISAEQIERVAGHPYAQCVDILLPGLRVQYPTLLDTLNDCETEVVTAEGGKFYDGVINGLLHLTSSYKVFLVRALLAGVDCHGLSGLPKHDMLVRIKREHALHNAVYIGDTAGDEAAAKLANLAFVYVSWGFGTPEGKPRTVNSFAELLTYMTVADTR